MIDLFDIIIALSICAIVFLLLRTLITYRTPKEKEYDKRLEESLKDEYIIDPETGIKITLEEAESGRWLAHDNEFRTVPDEELNKIPVDEEKQVEIALNYLRKSRLFTKTRLNDNEVGTLENTKILSGYDDWSYSNTYKFADGFIFLPTIDGHRIETHLMVWLKIQNIEGHYLFREKTNSEKFFDSIRNDDDIKLKDYECFTYRKSYEIMKINIILNKILPNNGLEIELDNNNLFIKTLRRVCLEDVKSLKLIIDKFV